MTDRLLRHLVPGAPRRLLAVVGAIVVLLTTRALGGHGPAPTWTLCLTLPVILAGQACTVEILLWRARQVAAERSLWRGLAVSATVAFAAVDIAGILHLLPLTGNLAAVPVLLGTAVAYSRAYTALLGWNRHRTSAADPQERLNGASGVLAGVALLAMLPHHGVLDGRPWWVALASYLPSSAALVCLGTVLCLPSIAGLRRDVRAPLLAGALVACLTSQWIALVAGPEAPGAAVAAFVAVICVCVAACLPRPALTVQPVVLRGSTYAACALVLLATGELVAARLTGAGALCTSAAALAAASAGLNMLALVNTQSDLAASRREALTDDLTGVGNRRAVLRRLDELAAAGAECALVMLDVDKFKDVNEGLGHSGGDDLLRLVAHRLRDALEGGELLGRLAGDEFAVVTTVAPPSTPDGAAAWLGARLITAMAEPFTLSGMRLHVSVSAGAVSTRPAGAPAGDQARWHPSDLLRRCDAAMNEVKGSGRGLALYDPQRHADASGNLALVEDLRLAIATGQILLHHQPQVDTTTGEVVGVEALVRWQHPSRGLLFPGAFIPLAEMHGLMGDLTEVVLEQAIAQAALWHHSGSPLRMSVNLSASNLLDSELPDRIAATLLHHALPARGVVFEVTESMLISDPERSAAILAELADLGARISIDDFGTGYASLSYLRSLPVSELKLDRSFTRDLLTDRRAAAIVESTVNLAHQLGLRVVGEGVEDEGTLAHLVAIGCDETQGYLHAKPMPAEAVPGWLAARRGAHRPA